MPSEDTIESVSSRNSVQRQNLWNRWQEVFDAMDNDLQSPGADPFESPAAKFLMKMGGHLLSQMSREAAQDRSKHIHEFGIKKLKDSHAPGAGLIALYSMQIIAGIAGTGLGCAPSVLGLAAGSTTASSYQAMSQGVNSVFGQGSQNVASIVQSGAQAEIAEINYEIERDKQIHSDHANEQQTQARLSQSHAEDEKKVEQARHEATKAMTQ
jgi:hypothetical protein